MVQKQRPIQSSLSRTLHYRFSNKRKANTGDNYQPPGAGKANSLLDELGKVVQKATQGTREIRLGTFSLAAPRGEDTRASGFFSTEHMHHRNFILTFL